MSRTSRNAVVRSVAGLFGGALLLSSSAANAQNYRSVPIGGRTATMGGAGIAAGNDSAMPYLNPAGIAGLPGDVFAVSASVYGVRNLRIDRALFPNGYPSDLGPAVDVQNTFASSSSFELPSAVMYVKRLSPDEASFRHSIAGSLVIPAHTDREFVASASARFPNTATTSVFSLASVEQARDMYLGVTWAAAYRDRLRFGVSVLGLYATSLRTGKNDSSFLLANGSLPARGSTALVEQTEGFGLTAVAGVQARLVSNLWLGLSIAAPSLPIGGSGNIQSSLNNVNVDVSAGSSTLESRESSIDVDVKVKRPLRIGLGLAWDDRSAFSFALDGVLFLAQPAAEHLEGVESATVIQTGQAARSFRTAFLRQRDQKLVVDVSAGAELRVTRVLSLRAGVMTSRSARPPIDAAYVTSFRGTLREDVHGASLGIGVTVGSFDSTLGLAYQYSKGQFPTVDVSQKPAPIVAVDSVGHALMLVLSGAITLEEALEKVAPSPTKVIPQ